MIPLVPPTLKSEAAASAKRPFGGGHVVMVLRNMSIGAVVIQVAGDEAEVVGFGCTSGGGTLRLSEP